MVKLTINGKPTGKPMSEKEAAMLLTQLKSCVLGLGMRRVK